MKKLLYKLAFNIITNRIKERNNTTLLTIDHLKAKGFIEVFDESDGKKYWVELDIKDRDKIWVELGVCWYRIWHGQKKTYVAVNSTKEWFDMYHFLIIN